MNKINIAVIFGGASFEHDVSRASALNIFSYLDTDKYNIIPIYITREGNWFLYDGTLNKLPPNIEKYCAAVTLGRQGLLRIVGDKVKIITVDVAISCIHGKYGEDGTIQGLFEMMNLPYVGCGVLASAVCMDKTHTRIIAEKAGIPCTPAVVINNVDTTDKEVMDELAKKVRSKLGYPCIIKPSSGGSSLGTNKAKNKKEIVAGIEDALKFDNKVIIEKFIQARELECAVLETPEGKVLVTVPGEIKSAEDFYTYDAKYNNADSKTIIPADVEEEVALLAMQYSERIFAAVGGSGLSRVDFFLDKKTGELIFNEINTMPGFTDISMYPMLVASMGMEPNELLDTLVQTALARG